MTVLYITSSARKEKSNSRAVGNYLVDKLGGDIIARDLATHPLPPISAHDLIAVHESNEGDSTSLQRHIQLSDELIEELNKAETLVFASPIYNFSVPFTLKHWIDMVCRAGITFKYSKEGPEGLINAKTAYIVTASGGTPIGSDMDFASGYLEHICRFLGVKNVHHIHANGSKGKPEEIVESGKKQVDELLAK